MIQKSLTVRGDSYQNFFFTPGCSDSLQQHVDDGWRVKIIKDNGYVAVILFEREDLNET